MAVAFVQGTGSQSSGSVASLSKAFASNVTAGNSIAVGGISNSVLLGTGSVTDSLGNTYTRQVAVDGISAGRAASCGYLVDNITGGACTVTVDPTGSDFISMVIAEFSGTETTGSIDGNGTFNAGSGTTLTTSTFTMAGGTNGNGAIFAAMEQNGTTTTLTAAQTEIFEAEDATNMPINGQYQTNVAAGSGKSATWTLGAGRSATAFAFGIKSGAAAGGRTTRNTRSNPLGVEAGMGFQMCG